jgi:prophage DNA circulation protein
VEVLDVEGMTALAGVDAMLSLHSFSPSVGDPGTATPGRVQEGDNLDAIQALVRNLAVVRAAQLAAVATYDSYDAAEEVRDRIVAAIDEDLEIAGDDVYEALLQLRADVITVVPGEDSALPKLVSYTPPATVPSVILTHQLYGDLEREADVLARNDVRHPMFVPGGVALEVLSSG